MAVRAATERSAKGTETTDQPRPALLGLGALARASGVPAATLSTWARRYGFPSPADHRARQRRFPLSHVERLRLIRRALALGHRAAQVLPAAPAELRRLVALASVDADEHPAPDAAQDADAALLDGVRTLDGERLTRILLEEWSRLTPAEFLSRRVAPLVVSVGEEWSTGALGVHHEHFLAARLSDLLGALRQPLERELGEPPVVLATLPGEQHTLGLSMAALALAHGGLRTLFLGAECPLAEIASAARGRRACAVGISVSRASSGRRTRRLLIELRRALPRSAELLLGGRGAVAVAGSRVLDSFPALVEWARQRGGGA